MTGETPRQGRRDPHEVLGVPRGADRQVVMHAFRQKARQGGHPDTGGEARVFDEFVRARDELVPARPAAGPHQRTTPAGTPPAAPTVRRSPTGPPPPRTSPQPRTDAAPGASPLAIATGVLTLLGPLFWPVAILVGHVALRHIRRTGMGGGTFVPLVLVLLYVLTLPTLARFLPLLLE